MTGSKPHFKSTWLLPVLSAIILVVPIALYFVIPEWRQWVTEAWTVLTSDDEQRIQSWVEDLGAWGPLVIIVLMTVQMFLFVVPSWLLIVIAVVAYNPVLGGALATIAVVFASSIGYGIGRLAGEPLIKKFLGETADRKIRKETDRYGVWAIVITRLNPLISNDAISIIAGGVRFGFWRFILATLGGIIPLVILIAFIGRESGSMRIGLAWLSGISLVGLTLKIWWDKRRERKD